MRRSHIFVPCWFVFVRLHQFFILSSLRVLFTVLDRHAHHFFPLYLLVSDSQRLSFLTHFLYCARFIRSFDVSSLRSVIIHPICLICSLFQYPCSVILPLVILTRFFRPSTYVVSILIGLHFSPPMTNIWRL